MRVYLQPPQPSRGLDRIATALRRYAPPEVQITTDPKLADLTIIYAIGRRDATERQCHQLTQLGKGYAVVQVCLRSTMTPNCNDWLEIWQGAITVWSYYGLHRLATEDSCMLDGWDFYHAPLGVDAGVFYPRWDGLRSALIMTTGLSRLSESVRECWLATEQMDRYAMHLGPLKGKCVWPVNGLTDDDLANAYSQCEFVSGLRRKEGFELPAAEGLLCGARPIVFDTPDYRWCYRDHAEYIEETDRPSVVDQLVTLFKQGARPVTPEERARAAEWFNWQTICEGFWQRCLS